MSKKRWNFTVDNFSARDWREMFGVKLRWYQRLYLRFVNLRDKRMWVYYR